MANVNFELRDAPLPVISSSMSVKELARLDSREMTVALIRKYGDVPDDLSTL
jgi:hypothetical protein